MKRSVISSVLISSCVLSFAAIDSRACGSGSNSSNSITNLFSANGDTFQVTGLNAAGQLTGYLFGNLPAHAFFYQDGLVTDLGTLGGIISEGFAINSSGQVVGLSYITDNARLDGFLYSGGSLLDLGTLGGSFSSASLINDHGQIAGDSLLPNSGSRNAFLYSNGSMVGLGTLGGSYSTAFGLNNAGQVAGESALANDDVHAFVSAGSGLLDLGTLGGTYSSAFSINDAGIIVGESSVSNSDVHAFIFSGGVMTDLGTFGGNFSSSFQVNSNGQVSGVATTAGEAETHGFIYTSGTLVDLGTLGGTSVSPSAINNRGMVVGTATVSDGTSRAFLWQANHLTDLNTVLPADSGWQLTSAQFINDAGRVVGFGILNGVPQWFILDLANGNNSPVAAAGADQTVDCQAQAILNGSGSSDPDGDVLAFEWSSGGNVLGTTAILTVSLPLGTNIITLKVTDPCGASSQTNTTVIVADTTPPNGSCPAPVTASADASCQAAVPNLVAQVIANDNCTPAQALIISQSPNAGTLVGLGAHPVTITVTDVSGNSSTCTVLFTVVDKTPPTILSTPAAFILSAGANCQAAVPNLLPNVAATDSCTPAEQLVKTQSPAAGTLIGAGNYSVVVTVTDASGNSSSASVPFSVLDTTAPAILSAPGPIKLAADATGHASVPNILSSVLANDNCTPVVQIGLAQNPATGTVLPPGLYSIIVTATDASGNSSHATVSLEIDDVTPPTFQSLAVSPNVLSPPNHQLVPVTVSATVSDNCDASPLVKIVSITCSEPTSPHDIQITGDLTANLAASKNSSGTTRVYTITVQATDASGNSSTSLVTVAVPKSNGSSGGDITSFIKGLKGPLCVQLGTTNNGDDDNDRDDHGRDAKTLRTRH